MDRRTAESLVSRALGARVPSKPGARPDERYKLHRTRIDRAIKALQKRVADMDKQRAAVERSNPDSWEWVGDADSLAEELEWLNEG